MVDASSSTNGNLLPPQYALKIAKSHLENARRTTDPELVAIFYNEARAALSRMEQPTFETLPTSDSSLDQSLREEITFVTSELNEMLNSLSREDGTQATHTKTDHLRYVRVE